MKYGTHCTYRSDCWVGNFGKGGTVPPPAYRAFWLEAHSQMFFMHKSVDLCKAAFGRQTQVWLGSGRRFHIWYFEGIYVLAHNDAGLQFENLRTDPQTGTSFDVYTVMARVRALMDKLLNAAFGGPQQWIAVGDQVKVNANAPGEAFRGRTGRVVQVYPGNPNNPIEEHGSIDVEFSAPDSPAITESWACQGWPSFFTKVLEET